VTGLPVTAGELVGLDYLNSVVRAHWRKVTEKDVANTSAETDLLNGEVTIGAGAMATNRMLRVSLDGDYLNNRGGTATLRIKVKLGSTVIIDTGAGPTVAASATRRPFQLRALIANLNSASVQWGRLEAQLGTAGALTDGVGSFSGMTAEAYVFATTNGTKAVDTSSARLLEVTVAHSVTHASLSCRLKMGMVELV
jgi:hypothetical protein